MYILHIISTTTFPKYKYISKLNNTQFDQTQHNQYDIICKYVVSYRKKCLLLLFNNSPIVK